MSVAEAIEFVYTIRVVEIDVVNTLEERPYGNR